MKGDTNSKSISDVDAKNCFEKLTKLELGVPNYQEVNSSDILNTQRRRLATISENHTDFDTLNQCLLAFADQAGLVINSVK